MLHSPQTLLSCGCRCALLELSAVIVSVLGFTSTPFLEDVTVVRVFRLGQLLGWYTQPALLQLPGTSRIQHSLNGLNAPPPSRIPNRVNPGNLLTKQLALREAKKSETMQQETLMDHVAESLGPHA